MKNKFSIFLLFIKDLASKIRILLFLCLKSFTLLRDIPINFSIVTNVV
jgi:hypothetical protein